MDLQRKIQQLRNDGDDEFADAIEDMIPRATVATALCELRRSLEPAIFSEETHKAVMRKMDTTITKLGLGEQEEAK